MDYLQQHEKVKYYFHKTLLEVESLIELIERESDQAFQFKDYEKASKLVEKTRKVQMFKIKLAQLESDLNSTLASPKPVRPKISAIKLRKKGRGTPSEEFYLPLLQALVDLGGSAPANIVVERVGEIMKNVLNDYDRMPLDSNPNELRWEKKTHWARFHLVQRGLLSNQSEKGIWEITESGRDWLEEHLDQSKFFGPAS